MFHARAGPALSSPFRRAGGGAAEDVHEAAGQVQPPCEPVREGGADLAQGAGPKGAGRQEEEEGCGGSSGAGGSRRRCGSRPRSVTHPCPHPRASAGIAIICWLLRSKYGQESSQEQFAVQASHIKERPVGVGRSDKQGEVIICGRRAAAMTMQPASQRGAAACPAPAPAAPLCRPASASAPPASGCCSALLASAPCTAPCRQRGGGHAAAGGQQDEQEPGAGMPSMPAWG